MPMFGTGAAEKCRNSEEHGQHTLADHSQVGISEP